MIQVSHISRDYGGRLAVDDLSFTLEKGTIYGFLGPNGAGKSTTMNMMTGYLAPSSGTITVNGHDLLQEAELAKSEIGYLPEIPPVYGDMTVDEYLMFAARLKKVHPSERRNQLAKIKKMTNLGDYGNRMIRNLSKGYRQRVGLAQALIGFPEIIILDEPTVGLDPQQIIEIRNLIRSLKEDHTVVLSSHILSEINAVCDEVMILSRGKLVAQGTPEELERRYSTDVSFYVTLLGQRDQVEGLFSGLENCDISFAERKQDLTEGKEQDEQNQDTFLQCTLKTDVDHEDAIRHTVACLLAKEGIPVWEMRKEHQTLEDVFLSLTQATPGEKGGETI